MAWAYNSKKAILWALPPYVEEGGLAHPFLQCGELFIGDIYAQECPYHCIKNNCNSINVFLQFSAIQWLYKRMKLRYKFYRAALESTSLYSENNSLEYKFPRGTKSSLAVITGQAAMPRHQNLHICETRFDTPTQPLNLIKLPFHGANCSLCSRPVLGWAQITVALWVIYMHDTFWA